MTQTILILAEESGRTATRTSGLVLLIVFGFVATVWAIVRWWSYRTNVTMLVVEHHRLISQYREELNRERAVRERIEESLRERMDRYQTQAGECRVAMERAAAEIRALEVSVQRIQAVKGIDDPGLTAPPAVVIAGSDGLIRHVSPSVGHLFNYLPEELQGKSIETIMAPQYKAAHATAMAKINESKVIPWSQRVLLGHGRRKDGSEFPVWVSLTAWKDDHDELMFSATIRARASAFRPDLEDLNPQGPARTPPPQ